MSKITYAGYSRLQQLFDKAEKNKNYRQLLSTSLEIIPLLGSKKSSNLDKNKIEKVYNYSCQFLCVLKEKSELKKFKRLSSRLPYSEIAQKEVKNALRKIEIIDDIYNFIDKNQKVDKNDLKEKIDISNSNINEILEAAIKIGKIEIQKNKNIRYYNLNKNLSLKNFTRLNYTENNLNNKNNILNRIVKKLF